MTVILSKVQENIKFSISKLRNTSIKLGFSELRNTPNKLGIMNFYKFAKYS